jgi:hypothetical protein
MYSKTDLIYRTALTYASYKNKPTTVNDELLDEMFRDLYLLADEYGYEHKPKGDYENERTN